MVYERSPVSFFGTWLPSFPATICLKDCNFLIAFIYPWLLCNKLVGRIMCGLISGLFILFHWSKCWFFPIHTVLIELCNTIWNQGRWCFNLCSFPILHWIFCGSTQIFPFFCHWNYIIILSFLLRLIICFPITWQLYSNIYI